MAFDLSQYDDVFGKERVSSMAHSHERTLISGLGFADPDKKNRRHDYACQYLAQESLFPVIAKLFFPKSFEAHECLQQLFIDFPINSRDYPEDDLRVQAFLERFGKR